MESPYLRTLLNYHNEETAPALFKSTDTVLISIILFSLDLFAEQATFFAVTVPNSIYVRSRSFQQGRSFD